jgi:hypothetical protein
MSERPILIGGCGRSGTTLLLSLLSAHPNIYAVPYETRAFSPGAYPPEDSFNIREPFRIDFLYSHFLDYNININEYGRWCEKTPMNVHFFNRLKGYFGAGLRFINIVRDGRDVVTSHHPQDPNKYWVSPSRWVRDVGAGRQFEGSDQFLTVKYENIVENHVYCLERICDFVGEAYSKRFESYPESASIQSSSAWFGKATSVRSRSEKRWKKEGHREVVEQLLESPKALSLMRHYEYL